MPTIEAITAAIDQELETMARRVIRSHLDLSNPANDAFLHHPDAREHHQMHWHQWGILTHTRMFLRAWDVEVPRYLREWGVWSRVDRWLSRPIDGLSRWNLLRVAILLHDIGKFAARTGKPGSFHFASHEALSRQIILCELDLHRFGLTPAQVDYIAEAAGDHFVLGIVRKEARAEGAYSEEFIQSRRFAQLCDEIKRCHADDFVEIGVLFLGDSLAKLRLPEGPQRAVSQYDLNLAVARRYLRHVLLDSDSPPAGSP